MAECSYKEGHISLLSIHKWISIAVILIAATLTANAATITVPANGQLSVVHDRMPAILRGDAIDQWLDVRGTNAKAAYQLALPLDDGLLKFHPVSTRVNSARMDDPGLIEPAIEFKPESPVKKRAAGGGSQMDLF